MSNSRNIDDRLEIYIKNTAENKLAEKALVLFNRHTLLDRIKDKSFKASYAVNAEDAYDFTMQNLNLIRETLEVTAKKNGSPSLAQAMAQQNLFDEIGMSQIKIEMFFDGHELPLLESTMLIIALGWYALDEVLNSIRNFAFEEC